MQAPAWRGQSVCNPSYSCMRAPAWRGQSAPPRHTPACEPLLGEVLRLNYSCMRAPAWRCQSVCIPLPPQTYSCVRAPAGQGPPWPLADWPRRPANEAAFSSWLHVATPWLLCSPPQTGSSGGTGGPGRPADSALSRTTPPPPFAGRRSQRRWSLGAGCCPRQHSSRWFPSASCRVNHTHIHDRLCHTHITVDPEPCSIQTAGSSDYKFQWVKVATQTSVIYCMQASCMVYTW